MVDSILSTSSGSLQVPQDGEPDSKYLSRQQAAVAEINKRGLVLVHACIQVTACLPTAALYVELWQAKYVPSSCLGLHATRSFAPMCTAACAASIHVELLSSSLIS